MNKDMLINRRNELLQAELHDELVGLDVENGTCYGFNSTATRVWALLETPRHFSELVTVLVREYEVDREQCGRELEDLLSHLEQRGLVSLTPSG